MTAFWQCFWLGIAMLAGVLPLHAQERLELHLVLAFDVSASVNDVEFDLQRTGTALALKSDIVSAAIDRAPGGVAIAIVQWSSVTRQALGLDWVELHDRDDVAQYAEAVAEMPRRLPGGGTMIHSGLEFSARLLEAAPRGARRQVIDIAGNGQSDDPKRLLETRDKLLSRGIVINGLAIEEDDDTLTNYFDQYVIGGPNAFVITATGFEDFASAMEVKLLREVSGAVYSLPATGGNSTTLAWQKRPSPD
ncbi:MULTISPECIES: DUF1194 domain-containing protein [unclassified Roseovarius]|uniref:DUF1194 domain-containing protein n=1 Tax=unclassified Roseovarius TaxID=2614913 RepID=UPI00273F0BE7|nr:MULTISPECIES: DUF1194 domain-containing protein [unclassified Roseovarius]